MPESIPKKMRAAVITAPGKAEVREVEVPTVGRDQALIRVEGCGVCGSNLPMWEGRPWFEYPTKPGTPGHEGWGRVVAVGPDATRVKVGDRVAFLSGNAFAEYDATDASSTLVLPKSLDGIDVPGEPLGCALNIWSRSQIQPEHTIAVIGIGFLGALVTQLAARAGTRVIAISQRPHSLDLAQQMGATETIAMTEDDSAIVQRVEELTGGALCDRVIELVGLQRPLDLAAKLCKVRGRLVIGGFHQDGPRSIDMFLWNWRGLDVVNAHERAPSAYVEGMAAAVDRIVSGQLAPASLYTHRLPLEQATEAFELLRQRPAGFVKALVMP